MIPAVIICCWLIRLLPVRLAGALGAGLGRLYYIIGSRHRRIALRNLKRVYPDSDPAWRIRMAHESFAELGRTTFEMPHVYLRSREFLRSRIVQFDGFDETIAAIESGKGVIFTGCHFANWEMAAMSMTLFGYQSDMIHRPLRNDAMEALLKRWRERFGNRLHARDENIRWIPRSLRQGKSLALLIDQHLSTGIPIPFLGHEGRTTVMPATYARRGTPVFIAILHRVGREFRFRAEFKAVEFPQATDNADADIIRDSTILNEAFRPAINSRPECWLWIHRRWLYLDEQESAA